MGWYAYRVRRAQTRVYSARVVADPCFRPAIKSDTVCRPLTDEQTHYEKEAPWATDLARSLLPVG